MSCVYKHTFPNGAVYIGRTDMEPEDRWCDGWGYRNLPAIFNAIVQYGWKNIKHEILYDNLTHEEAVALELEIIQELYESDIVMYNVLSTARTFSTVRTNNVAHTGTVNTTNIEHKRTHYKEHTIPLVEKPEWMNVCPIDVYYPSGTYITTYPSIKIASEELGVNAGNITSCCKGVRGTGQPVYQAKGYVFRYAPDKFKDVFK